VNHSPMKARSLAELALLRAALQAARREAEHAATRDRERVAQARREPELFAVSVGPVVPLRRPAAPAVPRPRPAPLARQRERDEAQALVQTMSDQFDVESLLETDDGLSFRRRGIGADVVRKLRRGVWATQAQLDLHGLRRDGARDRLATFLREASNAGLRCVRVVHGKGNGSPGRESVLKAKVKGWLVQRDEVIAFAQARAADGGQGALLVLLSA
jgi:DNA-nicking Smr family endonuclease